MSRGEGLWRFSLALYGRPGVAEALIRLQDRAGNDVNLVLYALWCGAVHGIPLDAASLRQAAAAMAPLADVAGRLRALRRALKPAPDADLQALRRGIAGLELAAERGALARLAELPREPSGEADRLNAAEANLALCLGAEAGSPEAAVIRDAVRGLIRR